MNDDFEKYLGNFTSVPPSGEFRNKVLAASQQAWKTQRTQSSIFSLLFSPRSLLWAQAAMIAAAVAFICVENTRTDKLLAEARPETENGTGKSMLEMCRESGLDGKYCRAIASASKLRAINGAKPINLAAYQKITKTIMEEGIKQ